jgi:hypothetical protein
MDVKNGKLGDAVQVADDIYPGYFRYLSDNRPVYFKNVDEDGDIGDMFIGDKEVDFDVFMYNITENEALGAVLYYTDYKEEKGGTLKMISGKEPVKISDDVYDFSVTEAGKLYYLYDFSDRNYTGELYLYGNKNQKIDDDVSALLYTCNTGTVVGYNYYW